jgi:hypothetical protein
LTARLTSTTFESNVGEEFVNPPPDLGHRSVIESQGESDVAAGVEKGMEVVTLEDDTDVTPASDGPFAG